MRNAVKANFFSKSFSDYGLPSCRLVHPNVTHTRKAIRSVVDAHAP